MSHKRPEDVRRGVESFARAINAKIVDELEENGNWILHIRQNGFNLEIIHSEDNQSLDIIFRTELGKSDQEILIRELTEQNQVVEFNYGLLSAINSPNIECSLRRAAAQRGDIVYVGFDIKARIFPYEDIYSIEKFNNAVQSVINAGRLGIFYFNLKLKSSRELIRLIESMNSSSEGMFL